jgi:hypothetical protein
MRGTWSVVGAAGCAGLVLAIGSPSATAQVVTGASPTHLPDGSLAAVTALSPDDVWAVGQNDQRPDQQTFAMHWDGTDWSMVATPSFANDELLGVSFASPDDGWTVGDADDSQGVERPLVEHWDGSAWSVETVPRLASAELRAVAAISADDVWAVGSVGARTLALHWDGTAWSRVPTPRPAPISGFPEGFHSIAVASPSDIWAAGYRYRGSPSQPLVEHWDGQSWSNAKAPHHEYDSLFGGVAAVDGGILAVGTTTDVSGDSSAFGARLDGGRWRRSTPPGGSNSALLSVYADGTGGAFAVGGASSGNDTVPLVDRWDGSIWTRQTPALPKSAAATLQSVSGTGPDDVWAVGAGSGADGARVLIEHDDGTSWSIIRRL